MQKEEIIQLQRLICYNNDQKAYKRLYLYFFKRLYGFAKSLTKHPEPAEEIVEDVFINLWQKRKKLTDIRNLKVYLFVAVRNRAFNFLQAQSKDMLSLFEDYPVSMNRSPMDPEKILLSKELEENMNRAVEQLPPRCKMIFKMVRFEKLKYKEVAEILNISPRTVDSQMTIAVKRLSEFISSYRSSEE